MKRHVFSNQTDKLLRIEEAVPECGDYCDRCGDCLHCHGETCYYNGDDNGEHFWVVYEDEPEVEGA